MKITDIKPYVLQYILPDNQRFCYSQAWYNTRTIMILKVKTDEGLTGWGEAFGPAHVNKIIIDKVYAPLLKGNDPFNNEVIWEELYNCLRDNGQKGMAIEALSAIDIALWDLKGKYAGKPVYKMMGGAFREKLKPYATGFYRRDIDNQTEALVEEALQYIKNVFSAIKIKIGFGIEDDIRNVKAIRKAVGEDIDIMVDANHAYNARDAITVGKQIEKYDIIWFEEPVPPEDKNGYIEVKDKLNIPIAGGEAEFTRFGFDDLINRRCVDIVQADCSVVGGLTEYKKITSMASIQNIQCYPHVWGSSIALATGIHAAFNQPDFPGSLNPNEVYLEVDRTPNIFREKLAKESLNIKDGYIDKPENPGLGLTIDRDLLNEYQIG